MSVTFFTPRCSFWTTRRFRILLRTQISHGFTFSRRGFPSLPSLRRWVKYLTGVRKSDRKGERTGLLDYKSSQLDAMFSSVVAKGRVQVRVQSTSVVHFHWSRLARDHFRILHYLLTYISMTCLRRPRAVDTINKISKRSMQILEAVS